MALIVVPHECSDEKEHIMCSSNLLSLLFFPIVSSRAQSSRSLAQLLRRLRRDHRAN